MTQRGDDKEVQMSRDSSCPVARGQRDAFGSLTCPPGCPGSPGAQGERGNVGCSEDAGFQGCHGSQGQMLWCLSPETWCRLWPW